MAGEREGRHGLWHEARVVHHGREEGAAVWRVVARGWHRCALGMLSEVVGTGVVGWGRSTRRGGCRHGVLPHVQPKAGLRIDAQVRSHPAAGLLGNRSKDVGTVGLRLILTRVLDEERWHGGLEHSEIHRHRHRPAALPLVTTSHARVQRWWSTPLRLLVHADVRLAEAWLR